MNIVSNFFSKKRSGKSDDGPSSDDSKDANLSSLNRLDQGGAQARESYYPQLEETPEVSSFVPNIVVSDYKEALKKVDNRVLRLKRATTGRLTTGPPSLMKQYNYSAPSMTAAPEEVAATVTRGRSASISTTIALSSFPIQVPITSASRLHLPPPPFIPPPLPLRLPLHHCQPFVIKIKPSSCRLTGDGVGWSSRMDGLFTETSHFQLPSLFVVEDIDAT
jgi:hypothetical protein